MKSLILFSILLIQTPAHSSDYYSTFKIKESCYGNIHREKYIEGDASKSGFVKKWKETVIIPCSKIELINKNLKEENEYKYHFKKILLLMTFKFDLSLEYLKMMKIILILVF